MGELIAILLFTLFLLSGLAGFGWGFAGLILGPRTLTPPSKAPALVLTVVSGAIALLIMSIGLDSWGLIPLLPFAIGLGWGLAGLTLNNRTLQLPSRARGAVFAVLSLAAGFLLAGMVVGLG